MKLRGLLPLPDTVESLLDEYDRAEDKSKNYLKYFNRKIDPIILGTFYGLYRSRSLPPLVEQKLDFSGSFDANVDISPYDNILNHLMFCLWINRNGLPNESPNISIYRDSLYEFIDFIINPSNFKDVIIPYYLSKASEDKDFEPSLISRFITSGEVDVEESISSPEYLSLEFSMLQRDFIEDVVLPLNKKIDFVSEDDIRLDKVSKVEPKEYLSEFENNIRNFIASILEEKIGPQWWKQRVPGNIKKACKERKDARESVPGKKVREYDLVHYLDFSEYFEIFKQSNNWEEVFKYYFKDKQWLYTKLVVELKPLRNDIAHNRELDIDERKKLVDVIEDLEACMDV